eukprot:EC826246.1.p1 GENE.EC826246.1~~EC826246.1.p1  ORF type:complete len:64 (+),score=21.06 EC826246.1:49-240(+)
MSCIVVSYLFEKVYEYFSKEKIETLLPCIVGKRKKSVKSPRKHLNNNNKVLKIKTDKIKKKER